MKKIMQFLIKDFDEVTPLVLVILVPYAVYALCFILPMLFYLYCFAYFVFNSLFDLSTYYHPSSILNDFNPFSWGFGPTRINIFAVVFNIILIVCIGLLYVNLIIMPLFFVFVIFTYILPLIFKQSFLDNFGEFSLGFLFAPYIYVQIFFPELAEETKARYWGCGLATVLYIVLFISWTMMDGPGI